MKTKNPKPETTYSKTDHADSPHDMYSSDKYKLKSASVILTKLDTDDIPKDIKCNMTSPIPPRPSVCWDGEEPADFKHQTRPSYSSRSVDDQELSQTDVHQSYTKIKPEIQTKSSSRQIHFENEREMASNGSSSSLFGQKVATDGDESDTRIDVAKTFEKLKVNEDGEFPEIIKLSEGVAFYPMKKQDRVNDDNSEDNSSRSKNKLKSKSAEVPKPKTVLHAVQFQPSFDVHSKNVTMKTDRILTRRMGIEIKSAKETRQSREKHSIAIKKDEVLPFSESTNCKKIPNVVIDMSIPTTKKGSDKDRDIPTTKKGSDKEREMSPHSRTPTIYQAYMRKSSQKTKRTDDNQVNRSSKRKCSSVSNYTDTPDTGDDAKKMEHKDVVDKEHVSGVNLSVLKTAGKISKKERDFKEEFKIVKEIYGQGKPDTEIKATVRQLNSTRTVDARAKTGKVNHYQECSYPPTSGNNTSASGIYHPTSGKTLKECINVNTCETHVKSAGKDRQKTIPTILAKSRGIKHTDDQHNTGVSTPRVMDKLFHELYQTNGPEQGPSLGSPMSGTKGADIHRQRYTPESLDANDKRQRYTPESMGADDKRQRYSPESLDADDKRQRYSPEGFSSVKDKSNIRKPYMDMKTQNFPIRMPNYCVYGRTYPVDLPTWTQFNSFYQQSSAYDPTSQQSLYSLYNDMCRSYYKNLNLMYSPHRSVVTTSNCTESLRQPTKASTERPVANQSPLAAMQMQVNRLDRYCGANRWIPYNNQSARVSNTGPGQCIPTQSPDWESYTTKAKFFKAPSNIQRQGIGTGSMQRFIVPKPVIAKEAKVNKVNASSSERVQGKETPNARLDKKHVDQIRDQCNLNIAKVCVKYGDNMTDPKDVPATSQCNFNCAPNDSRDSKTATESKISISKESQISKNYVKVSNEEITKSTLNLKTKKFKVIENMSKQNIDGNTKSIFTNEHRQKIKTRMQLNVNHLPILIEKSDKAVSEVDSETQHLSDHAYTKTPDSSPRKPTLTKDHITGENVLKCDGSDDRNSGNKPQTNDIYESNNTIDEQKTVISNQKFQTTVKPDQKFPVIAVSCGDKLLLLSHNKHGQGISKGKKDADFTVPHSTNDDKKQAHGVSDGTGSGDSKTSKSKDDGKESTPRKSNSVNLQTKTPMSEKKNVNNFIAKKKRKAKQILKKPAYKRLSRKRVNFAKHLDLNTAKLISSDKLSGEIGKVKNSGDAKLPDPLHMCAICICIDKNEANSLTYTVNKLAITLTGVSSAVKHHSSYQVRLTFDVNLETLLHLETDMISSGFYHIMEKMDIETSRNKTVTMATLIPFPADIDDLPDDSSWIAIGKMYSLFDSVVPSVPPGDLQSLLAALLPQDSLCYGPMNIDTENYRPKRDASVWYARQYFDFFTRKYCHLKTSNSALKNKERVK